MSRVQETVVATPVSFTMTAAGQRQTSLKPAVEPFTARLQKQLPWIVAAWLGIVCLLSLRLLLGYGRVRRIRRLSCESLGVSWTEKLVDLANQLRVSRPVRLCQSALVEVPTVIGWLRPVILFPASALAGLSPAQLEAILAHELAHVRRHDYLVNLLQNLIETLLFYHPAVWWVSRQLSQERELCCDDLTVLVCGDRMVYATALAMLEESRCAAGGLALAATGGSLLGRIRRLAGLPTQSDRSGWWLAGTVALLLVGAFLFVSRGSLIAAASAKAPNASGSTSTLAGSAESAPPGGNGNQPLAPETETKPSVPQLLSRTWQLDPDTFFPNLARTLGETEVPTNLITRSRLVRAFVGKLGIDLALEPATNRVVRLGPNAFGGEIQVPGGRKAIFLSHGNGMLSVRVTKSELDRIEAAVEFLNTNSIPTTTPKDGKTESSRVPSPPPSLNDDVATLIRDARLLIELGKLDEAEAKLAEAVKQDPENKKALSYLNFIREMRQSTKSQVETILRQALADFESNQYSIEDYAVVISRRTPGRQQLYTRTFRVDPNTFVRKLGEVMPDQNVQTNLNEAVWTFCRRLGIDLLPDRVTHAHGSGLSSDEFPRPRTIPAVAVTTNDRAIFFNDRTGILFARATLEDLDIIEQGLAVLNYAPKQIQIDAKWVELSDVDAKALGLDWFLDRTRIDSGGGTNEQGRPNPSAFSTNASAKTVPSGGDDRRMKNAALAAVTGVLTEAQFNYLMKVFKQRSGVTLLASPSVTTVSGRPAQLEVAEPRKVVIGRQITTTSKSDGDGVGVNYLTEDFPVGSSVEVTPRALDDPNSIQIEIGAKTTEFVGYDEPTPEQNRIKVDGAPDSSPLTAVLPLPRFRIREARGNATIWDGQTIVLSGFRSRETRDPKVKVPVLGDLPLLGRLFRSDSASKTNKHLLLFVTPTIVDPAGNRVRSQENSP